MSVNPTLYPQSAIQRQARLDGMVRRARAALARPEVPPEAGALYRQAIGKAAAASALDAVLARRQARQTR